MPAASPAATPASLSRPARKAAAARANGSGRNCARRRPCDSETASAKGVKMTGTSTIASTARVPPRTNAPARRRPKRPASGTTSRTATAIPPTARDRPRGESERVGGAVELAAVALEVGRPIGRRRQVRDRVAHHRQEPEEEESGRDGDGGERDAEPRPVAAGREQQSRG